MIYKIRKINLWLLTAFLGTAASGISLHIAGHRAPEARPSPFLSVVHIIFAIIFIWLVIIHIKRHRRWFTSGKITTVIPWLLALFAGVETFSGAMLLIADVGAHLHWAVGLLLTLFCTIHITAHRKIIKNTLSR